MAGDKHSISPHRNPVNQETESISLQHCCSEMRHDKMVSSETTVGPDHRTRPRDPHLLECAERNKIGSPIHTGYFLIGEANTLIFIVDGGNTVNSFVMGPLEHGRATWQHDTDVQIHADVNGTLHVKEVSWTLLASLLLKLGWTSTFTQQKRSAPSTVMFPSGEVVLDLYRGWSQRRQHLRHVLEDPSEHGRGLRWLLCC